MPKVESIDEIPKMIYHEIQEKLFLLREQGFMYFSDDEIDHYIVGYYNGNSEKYERVEKKRNPYGRKNED